MALKFGPQWLRDLSDGGTSTSQPSTPPMSVKFKLAEYRYGREEMLSLFNDNSPPPDQVRKHLSIFSKEIQKPITMSPLTEEEQRLISQGFNSTVVLRAAGRGSGPPLRTSRGGGTADRGRGRGRGRGEGYISRAENGDVGFSRSTQDGWEHVGRKFERSFSRGYEESGSTKREFSRSSSDNWRDKRHDDDEDEESGVSWRNARENNQRWGPSTRSNWREPQRDLGGFDGDRRPQHLRRGFDQDPRGPRRTSESYENEGEVPEWVEDDVGDDPGTFDSSGAFVSIKERKGLINSQKPQDDLSTTESQKGHGSDKGQATQMQKPVYVPPNARNGTGDANDPSVPLDQPKPQPTSDKGRPDSLGVPLGSGGAGYSNKGDGDSGFAFPTKEGANGTRAPPGQYANTSNSGTVPHVTTTQGSEPDTNVRLTDPDFLHMEKSLQNLVAEMSADTENTRGRRQIDVSQGALPLTHENSNKWFYKDPQGEVQGPFTNDEMTQWFSAGYFTMNLVVKRGCDDSFKQLGELIKRYGRVPFLPGPPLPPLITSSIPTDSSVASTPSSTIPSLVSPMSAAPLVGPGMPSVHDPILLQQMLLQQEYLKQSFLMRQMQLQTLHQMQEQESFKALPLDQQHQLSMQMMIQANPAFMQNMHHIQQQQQLLLQQQQQQQQEQQRASPANPVAEGTTASFQQSQPSSITTTTLASTTTNNNVNPDSGNDENSVWGAIQQRLNPGVWSQPSSQPSTQPASLWDVDTGNETLSPAYQAQLEKMKREREEERLKEEERQRQEDLEKKQEELRRQQEELERQREQMRKEKEDLERQKQLELQKIEEARRQDEERIRREIERQQREQQEEEKRRQENERKQQEDERKREKELKKQEDKKRKEEEKRKQQEEQKRQQEEVRRKKQEEEMHRQQELQLQREQEMMRQQELQRQVELQQQQEEEERMQREAVERERQEAQRRQQQYELQRQQESLRRLQQAQREQLANMQLPATSNWAAQQQNTQGSPSQSRSLTEIQEEEARREQERQREQQLQMQRMQEQAYLTNQQHQPSKSWATHASQGVPTKGLSLLDIQQQEQEKAKKSQKETPNTQTYQAKLSLASSSTWTGSSTGGTWGGQAVWNNSSSSTAGFWDQVAPSARKSAVKESGEFPALKNPSQQAKKNSGKANKTKGAGAKQKKEEESVQKLFQTRQQDDFSQWVTDRVSQFSAPIDVPTFVSFIVEVDSPDDVREYMKTYLGDTKETKDFARQFVDKRNYFRNQARLEKQQEEDSIWGPAPAINPHNQMRGGGGSSAGNNSVNDSNESGSGKGKNRKKKQKMQKLDGSILGFTVHADPNRKNAAGEVESIQ